MYTRCVLNIINCYQISERYGTFYLFKKFSKHGALRGLPQKINWPGIMTSSLSNSMKHIWLIDFFNDVFSTYIFTVKHASSFKLRKNILHN